MAAIVKVALLSTLLIGHAHAAQCPLIPAGIPATEIFQASKLLQDGKFSEVDAILVKLHKNNLTSEGGDLLTSRHIDALVNLSEEKEELLRRWFDEQPQSFFSQLSAGIFFVIQASKARGTKFASETSQEQFKKMAEINLVAMDYLQKAMLLDASSALPHSIILGIAARQNFAAQKTPTQWLFAALQTDPNSLAARVNAMTYFSPRWGGSFEFLEQIVLQSEKSLSAQSVHYLRYNIVMEKAIHEEVVTKNKPQANELYKQALGMCENSTLAREGIERTSK